LTSVTTVTAAADTAGAGEAGLAAGTYYVWVAAVGGNGQTIATSSGAVTVTSLQVVRASWTAVAGAVSYNVYTSNTGATAATAFFYSTSGFNGTGVTASAQAVVIQAPFPTSGSTAPTANTTTQNGIGYDGIMTITTGSSTGYTKNLNAKFSTTNPGVEYQNAFATMYGQNLADPDEILMNGADRKQLSTLLTTTGGTTGYRINIEGDNTTGHSLGALVGGINNTVTGKYVPLTVHPYMPQGSSAILTHTLPYPDSEVPSTWSFVNVQDYMGIAWPEIQLTKDFSSFWYGTFLCYAPAWQGSVVGIAAG
jgi:hypothetical protein